MHVKYQSQVWFYILWTNKNDSNELILLLQHTFKKNHFIFNVDTPLILRYLHFTDHLLESFSFYSDDVYCDENATSYYVTHDVHIESTDCYKWLFEWTVISWNVHALVYENPISFRFIGIQDKFWIRNRFSDVW